MSRFKKLTHVLWHCQYHLVWVPKYRYRILTGAIGAEVHNCIEVYCSRLRCEVVGLNVQSDHVHLLLEMPPKMSISQVMGTVKGKSALRVFTRYPNLRKMGQSLLGQGLLCRYGGLGRGNDTKVCKISGETGTKTTTPGIRLINE